MIEETRQGMGEVLSSHSKDKTAPSRQRVDGQRCLMKNVLVIFTVDCTEMVAIVLTKGEVQCSQSIPHKLRVHFMCAKCRTNATWFLLNKSHTVPESAQALCIR